MKVLFFATAREATGCASDDLAVKAPASADEIWKALTAKHPALAPLRGVARLSRNDEYADADAQFLDADVVAVIPPVSGG
jgi:molybdopterin synthase catalytic subunit/molybdopterin synthase sulfur carrier subunit